MEHNSRLKPGKEVAVKDGGLFLGEGRIVQVSTDIHDEGHGTKLYPRYLVEFYDGTSGWFTSYGIEEI